MSRVLRGIAVGFLLVVSVHAQPPLLINYQGRILSGTNLLQGAVELHLRLFAGPAGGPLLYEDTGTVTVVDGVYGTMLGDGTASGDLLTALSQPAVYLEMAVNGTTLAPRERLASVPYALKALETLQHVEQDPRWSGASNLYYLRTEADAQFATGTPVYVESDPAFSASVAAGLTSAQTGRWEAAYGWGDHAGAGYLTSYVETDPLWSAASNSYYTAAQAEAAFATGTPVYAESDPMFGASVAAGITSAQTSQWETAYGWGDHSVAGYLTSYTETDPVWAGASNAYYTAAQVDAAFATGTPVYAESDPVFGASIAAAITSAETTRWETAHGWGDHGAAGYLTGFTEVDPLWSAASNSYYTVAQADAAFATGTPVYAESDPAFSASVAAGITSMETTRWETAYGWGDHAAAGYLTEFTEVDPLWSGASNSYYTSAQVDTRFATGTPVYAESDPMFGASVASAITSAETTRWETAYGWGDHAAAGYLTGFTEVDPLWSAASNAYYTAAQVEAAFATGTPLYVESDPAFAASVAAGITSAETTRWETAYGWGDHGDAGYLTGFTETDPLWAGASNAYYTAAQVEAAFATGTPVYAESDPGFTASVAAGLTSAHTTRWETAYGWGDHGVAGYLTGYTEADPLWSAASNAYYTAAQVDAVFATGTPVYAESDPVFSASVAAGITSTETTRWETAYGWGDHGAAGYLTGFAETDPLWSAASNAYYTAAQADAVFATGTPLYVESDPVFGASVAAEITSAQTSQWEAAFSWGDHGAAGYLTGFTETDPLWSGASNSYYTSAQVDARFATGTPVYAESDPMFGASVASAITSAETGRWETAYGWGDHGVAGYLTSFVETDPQWSAASNAYYTAVQADAVFATGTPLYVESDPVFGASVASAITSAETGRWETAYGWGDHGVAGYLTSFTETDPLWSAASNAYYTAAQADAVFATGTPLYVESDAVWTGASNLYYQRTEADALFATGTPLYVESDAVFSASVAAGITSTHTMHWETAYGWGDHGVAGYLTSFVETDPLWAAASNAYYTAAQADARFSTGAPLYVESDALFAASAAAQITATHTGRWETAFGWGDHAAAGYMTGAASSNSFVRKAGDTMAGTLVLPAGGLVVGTTQLVVLANGNVGIGTATPTNQLAVNGSIKAREVIVTANNWPDYVFAPDYRLAPLRDVQAYIAENGHLPGVPSARQIEQEGVPLGELGATLLRKIEELTLHQIALEQENERLRRDMDELRAPARPVSP